MKLHWSPRSPYVRKVMICAHELELVPRLELIRSVAAMLKPNKVLMRDNPLSKIPTLILPDGTALFDSVVICEYLNDVAQGNLFPSAGEQKWQALRWHAFGDGLLDALILWRNERERQAPLTVLLEAFQLKTQASLTQLNEDADALIRSHFTIGHVALGCALGYLDFRFDDFDWRSQVPRLAGWYSELETRPSFLSTKPAEG